MHKFVRKGEETKLRSSSFFFQTNFNGLEIILRALGYAKKIQIFHQQYCCTFSSFFASKEGIADIIHIILAGGFIEDEHIMHTIF